MKRKPVRQIADMIAAAATKERAYIAVSEHETNPQIVAMVLEARGRLDAYEAVTQALDGNIVMLSIAASSPESSLP